MELEPKRQRLTPITAEAQPEEPQPDMAEAVATLDSVLEGMSENARIGILDLVNQGEGAWTNAIANRDARNAGEEVIRMREWDALVYNLVAAVPALAASIEANPDLFEYLIEHSGEIITNEYRFKLPPGFGEGTRYDSKTKEYKLLLRQVDGLFQLDPQTFSCHVRQIWVCSWCRIPSCFICKRIAINVKALI